MRLLVFYPYIPYPTNRGAYYRAFHLLRALATRHEVDLLALAEQGEGMEHKDVFQQFCQKVEFVSFSHPAWQKLFPGRLMNPLPSTTAHWDLPVIGQALGKLMGQRRYDAVHICDIILAQYFLKRHKEVPLIADRTRVDLQYQLMEQKHMGFSLKNQLLNLENVSKLWVYERAVAKRVRAEVVCGPDDEEFVRKFVSRTVPVEVIPNGVDLEYFHPEAAPGQGRANAPTILFCGAMDYNPNIDALRWYFSEIHTGLRELVPDLRVLIVGKDPVTEVKQYGEKPNVTVTGGVPDVRPYYRRAWLQIVPLRIGGGTRLKIVESLAMKTPVVSTTIGAQGLALKHGHDIWLADNATDFIRETARALKDSPVREQVSETGFHTVRERLSWDTLGGRLASLYTSLFGAEKAGKPVIIAEG